VLERATQVLIQDDLLTLWSMGLSEQVPMSQLDLSRHALFFLLLTDMDNSVVNRDRHLELFAKIPKAYTGYVKKETVAAVAAWVFGQDLDHHYTSRVCRMCRDGRTVLGLSMAACSALSKWGMQRLSGKRRSCRQKLLPQPKVGRTGYSDLPSRPWGNAQVQFYVPGLNLAYAYVQKI
jgi:hypothetical protein